MDGIRCGDGLLGVIVFRNPTHHDRMRRFVQGKAEQECIVRGHAIMCSQEEVLVQMKTPPVPGDLSRELLRDVTRLSCFGMVS